MLRAKTNLKKAQEQFIRSNAPTARPRATKTGALNNNIAEHHLRTSHIIDWDSATCSTYSTDYYQRITLKSWFTSLEQTALNRCTGNRDTLFIIHFTTHLCTHLHSRSHRAIYLLTVPLSIDQSNRSPGKGFWIFNWPRLDSEDCFRKGCRNFSHKQVFLRTPINQTIFFNQGTLGTHQV